MLAHSQDPTHKTSPGAVQSSGQVLASPPPGAEKGTPSQVLQANGQVLAPPSPPKHESAALSLRAYKSPLQTVIESLVH